MPWRQISDCSKRDHDDKLMLIKTAKGVRLVKKAREQAFPRV